MPALSFTCINDFQIKQKVQRIKPRPSDSSPVQHWPTEFKYNLKIDTLFYIFSYISMLVYKPFTSVTLNCILDLLANV